MNSDIFENIPEYETQSLILKQLSLDDVGLMYQFNANPECLKYIARTPYTHICQAEGRVTEFVDAIHKHKALWWTLRLKECSTLIGFCGLFDIDKSVPKAEIGYGLLQKFWGKGYASEAIAILADKGLAELKFHRLYAHVVPENKGSSKALIKNGFSYEGLLRKNAYARGVFFDMEVWAKIK